MGRLNQMSNRIFDCFSHSFGKIIFHLKLSILVDSDVASQSIFFLNSILLLYPLYRLYSSNLLLSHQVSKAFSEDALQHYWFLTMWNAHRTTKLSRTTYLQSISPMHLFRDHSHGYPIRCAGNRIKNFHFPSTQHHPTKFDQFRRRIGHSLGHLPHQNIPAGDKRLVRQIYPRSHHKLFPICYCDILQLFLPSFQILQPVLNLKSKKNMGKWDVSLVDTVYSLSVKVKGARSQTSLKRAFNR